MKIFFNYWFVRLPCILIQFKNFIKDYIINQKRFAYNQSFIFWFLTQNLNLDVKEGSEKIIDFCSSILILSLICLLCFFNVIGYILSIYLINKYGDKIKHPWLKWIINKYNRTNLIFLVIEASLCVIILVTMIFLCSLELGIDILNKN